MNDSKDGTPSVEGLTIPFDGGDLFVRALTISGSRQLVVTFSGRSARPPAATGFGEDYFLKRRISAVHFISKANHWWQTPELSEAIRAVREAGLLTDVDRITLYGSSMGGFAAMIRSRELSADQIIAVSPQFSIDGAVVPFETRWRDYAAKLSFEHDDMAAGLDREIPLWVIVDPLFAPDIGHVRLTEALRPVSRIAVTLAGHNTARALEECGLMRPMLQELLEERFDLVRWPERYRAVRTRSCLVWFGLAELLIEHGRTAWAHAPAAAAAEMVARGGRMRDGGLQQQILRLGIASACARRDAPAAGQWLEVLRGLSTGGRGTLVPEAELSLLEGDPGAGLAALGGLKQAGEHPEVVVLQLRLLTASGERGRLARAIEAANKHCGIAAVALAQAEGELSVHAPERARAVAEAALRRGIKEPGLNLIISEQQLREGDRDAAGTSILPLLRGAIGDADTRRRVMTVAHECDLEEEAQRFSLRCARTDTLYRAVRTARAELGTADPAVAVTSFREAVRRYMSLPA